jgi:hypothetical protein
LRRIIVNTKPEQLNGTGLKIYEFNGAKLLRLTTKGMMGVYIGQQVRITLHLRKNVLA